MAADPHNREVTAAELRIKKYKLEAELLCQESAKKMVIAEQDIVSAKIRQLERELNWKEELLQQKKKHRELLQSIQHYHQENLLRSKHVIRDAEIQDDKMKQIKETYDNYIHEHSRLTESYAAFSQSMHGTKYKSFLREHRKLFEELTKLVDDLKQRVDSKRKNHDIYIQTLKEEKAFPLFSFIAKITEREIYFYEERRLHAQNRQKQQQTELDDSMNEIVDVPVTTRAPERAQTEQNRATPQKSSLQSLSPVARVKPQKSPLGSFSPRLSRTPEHGTSTPPAKRLQKSPLSTYSFRPPRNQENGTSTPPAKRPHLELPVRESSLDINDDAEMEEEQENDSQLDEGVEVDRETQPNQVGGDEYERSPPPPEPHSPESSVLLSTPDDTPEAAKDPISAQRGRNNVPDNDNLFNFSSGDNEPQFVAPLSSTRAARPQMDRTPSQQPKKPLDGDRTVVPAKDPARSFLDFGQSSGSNADDFFNMFPADGTQAETMFSFNNNGNGNGGNGNFEVFDFNFDAAHNGSGTALSLGMEIDTQGEDLF